LKAFKHQIMLGIDVTNNSHTAVAKAQKFQCWLRHCLDITKALATRVHPSSYFVSPKFHLVLLFCVLVRPRGHHA
jgi:hypothetical protein